MRMAFCPRVSLVFSISGGALLDEAPPAPVCAAVLNAKQPLHQPDGPNQDNPRPARQMRLVQTPVLRNGQQVPGPHCEIIKLKDFSYCFFIKQMQMV